MSPDQGFGIPGWFVALFILFAALGVGGVIWRVAVARKIAEDAGLDPNQAAAVTILSNDGVGAAYLASTIAARSPRQPPPVSELGKTVEERLQELQSLKAKGLVTDDEYEAQRHTILGSI